MCCGGMPVFGWPLRRLSKSKFHWHCVWNLKMPVSVAQAGLHLQLKFSRKRSLLFGDSWTGLGQYEPARYKLATRSPNGPATSLRSPHTIYYIYSNSELSDSRAWLVGVATPRRGRGRTQGPLWCQ